MSDPKYTNVEAIPGLCAKVRDSFNKGVPRPLEWRKEQLRAAIRMVDENRERFHAAAKNDINKPTLECDLGCLNLIQGECQHLLDDLDELAAPELPSVPLLNKFDNAQIRKDPLGCVLVIGAWNYPFSLSMVPMLGAIAAGNSVVCKPSELSWECAQLMEEMIHKYFDNSAIEVVNGAVKETSALLEQKWDHIFYTGGTAVGKIVYKAAAPHLCPVTLELGGKSPVLVDDDCDIKVAARRITWGRFMNSGQTCIAPDYILCSKNTAYELTKEMKLAIEEFWGKDPQTSADYGRIVNNRHFKRITSLIDEKKVAFGGKTDENDRYISPTIMDGCTLDDPVMQEEIFGPILPIVHVDNLDEGVKFVLDGEKPLALYIFTNNKKAAEHILSVTSSGGACVNDCIMHAACPSIPFGGVGHSGMGNYHGRFSFDTFVHKKGTLIKDLGMESVNSIRYPPYTQNKGKILAFLNGGGLPFVGTIGKAFNIIPWNFIGPVAAATLVYTQYF